MRFSLHQQSIFSFFFLALPVGVWWYHIVLLILTSLMTKEVQHFSFAIGHLVFSVVVFPLKPLAHFCIQLPDFFILICRSSLYIWYMNPLSDTSIMNIFSHSVIAFYL